MMPSKTVWPRSGSTMMSPSAITAAGISGTSISLRLARSIRRAARMWEPHTTKAILASSEGCMDSPATTNQPRVPLASCPMPGMSTNTSIATVVANAAKAMRRRNRTGSRSANQQANNPITVHSS